MKRYWNNKGRFSSIMILIFLSVLSVLIYSLVLGYYQAKYTESAHGNNPSGAGVNRSATSIETGFGYPKGNCTHCHEAHASIGGGEPSPTGGPDKFGLFAPMNPTSQTNNFCFQCHKGAGSVQFGGITNYTYSKNFGGGTATFNNIYDAFNATGSSHNLSDVLNHALKGTWGFTSNDSACIVCHNPHTAQRNYPPTINAMNGVNTAERYHGHHLDNDYNLWGDEPAATSGLNELMSDWTVLYQAPYCVGKTTYEPACNSTQNGTNLPNFVVSCRTGCHRGTGVWSTERARNLYAVNWTNDLTEPGNRSVHGKFAGDPSGFGNPIAPYTDNTKNYVLSCTDCHEPHGSPNEWLLRTTVNGKVNISITSSGCWMSFCTACHVLTGGGWHQAGTQKCSGCHYHNYVEGYF